MERETLIAAVVGGLIATIPILVSNTVQIILHISGNRQKEKEGRIQAREKWIERDILKIMDSLEQILRITSELDNLDSQVALMKGGKEARLLSKDEFIKQFKSLVDRVPPLLLEGSSTFAIIDELVHSFEEPEIDSSYTDFRNARNAYWQQLSDALVNRINELGSESIEHLDSRDSRNNMTENAGRFHRALRKKLISIRDT